MKIKDIKIFPREIKKKKPFRIALGTRYFYEGVLVRVETEEGIYGWGEAAPSFSITGETMNTIVVVAEKLKEGFIGREVAIEALEDVRKSILHHSAAKAAFDIALHDIIGKHARLPLKTFFGGSKEKIKTDMSIGIESIEETEEDVRKYLEQGFKVIKLKIGLDRKEDEEKVRRIRESLGYGFELTLDANQGYGVREAIKTMRGMERYEIEFVEQPIPAWDVSGLREVRRNISIPLMADEAVHCTHDAFRVLSEEACDYINVKLMKAGGLHEASKIVTLAESCGVKCMMGCMTETRVGITAATHLALGRRNIVYADLDGHVDLLGDPTLGGIEIEDGYCLLSDKIGLGCDVNL